MSSAQVSQITQEPLTSVRTTGQTTTFALELLQFEFGQAAGPSEWRFLNRTRPPSAGRTLSEK